MNIPKSIIEDGILHCSAPGAKHPEPTQNLAESYFSAIKEKVENNGDRKVLINATLVKENQMSDEISFQYLMMSDVEPASRAMAQALHNFGISKGDVVHISLPNTTQFSIPIFGAWIIGATASMGDAALSSGTMRHQLEEADAKLVITYEPVLKKIIQALTDSKRLEHTKIILMDLQEHEALSVKHENCHYFQTLKKGQKAVQEVPNAPYEPNAIAAIIWSSGTTGRPKGVLRDFKSFVHTLHPSSNTGISLRTCSMNHLAGFQMQLSATLGPGMYYFLSGSDLKKNRIPNVLDAIPRFQVELLVCTPIDVMELYYKDDFPPLCDLSSLKAIIPAGSNIKHGILGEMKSKFPGLQIILNYYGMTEFSRAVSWSNTTDNLGQVFPGARVKIVDLQHGNICRPNEVGEILAKSDFMTPGYVNRPEETAALFTDDGFMRTGDLGHYDSDLTLHFDGRKKEMIKSVSQNGYTYVYPNEIEKILNGHPDVLSSASFSRPDPKVMELVTALVIKKKNSKLTEKELADLVQEETGDTYKDFGLAFVEELPTNSRGKLVRNEMIDLYFKHKG